MKFRILNAQSFVARALVRPAAATWPPSRRSASLRAFGAVLVFASMFTSMTPAQTPAKPAAVAAAAAGSATAKTVEAPGAVKPFKPEALHYTINWPSGLSLGDVYISSSKATLASGEGFTYTLKADASLPGFKLQEMANSTATTGYCTLDLEKESQRGKKKVQEKTTFEARTLTASRETLGGGGKSELKIGACAKDALDYVFFLRRELSQGRLPAAQKVYYGSAYDVRPEFSGTQTIRLGEESIEADRLLGHIKGPKSDLTIEMFFSKDPARLPLMIRIPAAQGKMTVELVR